MHKLTGKEEAACQAYIECAGNQSEAYRTAYACDNAKPETIWNDASKVFKRPHVIARVLELQSMHAKRHCVTVDSITKELDESRELAKTTENPAAMTTATMGKAKIHGLITDKVKTDMTLDVKSMSDDELKAIIDGGE